MEPNDGGMRAVIDSLARTPLSIVLLYLIGLTALRWVLQPLVLGKRSFLTILTHLLSEVVDAVIYAGALVFFIVRPFFLQAYNIPSGSMVSTLMVNDYIVANKLIYRFQDPRVGEVVVFRPPKEATRSFERDDDGEVNVDFIKRCIGGPGDRIEFRQDVLYRNGKPVEEPYRHFMTEDPPGQDDVYREMRPDELAVQLKESFKLVRYRGQVWPVLDIDDAINDSELTAPEYRVNDSSVMDTLRRLPPIEIPAGYYLMVGDNRLHSFDGRSWGLVPRDSIIGRAEFIWLPISRAGRVRSDAGK